MDEFEAMLESAKVPAKPKTRSARRPSGKHKNKRHNNSKVFMTEEERQISKLEHMLDIHDSIWHDDDWYEGMNDD